MKASLPDLEPSARYAVSSRGLRSFNSSAVQLLTPAAVYYSNTGDRSWQLEGFCFSQCEFHARPPPPFLEGRFQFGGDFDTMHANLQKLAGVTTAKPD